MKKRLLAIAIGTAMAAPGAVLADDHAEVYGKINLSWDNVEPSSNNNYGTVNYPHQQEINSHQSYLGVRGSGELFPMGLTGFYQLEYQVAPQRTSTLVNRESFLGLASQDFGTVKVGRFNTPMAELGRMVDQFSDYTWSDIGGMMRGQVRGRNYVQYSSPEFGRMLTFNIAGPTSEGTSVQGNANPNTGLWDSFSSSLVFDLGGDIYAGLGYDYNQYQTDIANDAGGFGGGFGGGSLSNQAVNGPFFQAGLETTVNPVDILRFVVGAKLDALEVGFLYQTSKTTQDIMDTTGDGNVDSEGSEDSIALNAGFMITPDTKLMAQWVDTSMDETDDGDYSQWTLGVDHRIGDRTKVYSYATNREAEWVVNPGTPTEDSGSDRDFGVFTLGMEHRF